MTLDITELHKATETKAKCGPTDQNTHPATTEGQTLSNDVDAKYLEDFLRVYVSLGHILRFCYVQGLSLRWASLLLLDVLLGHLLATAGGREPRDGAMPQHCKKNKINKEGVSMPHYPPNQPECRSPSVASKQCCSNRCPPVWPAL